MMDTHSMARRLIVGKTIGLAIGLLGFFMLPVFLPGLLVDGELLRLGQEPFADWPAVVDYLRARA